VVSDDDPVAVGRKRADGVSLESAWEQSLTPSELRREESDTSADPVGRRTPLGDDGVSRRGQKVTERLGNPEAVLSRSDLRELGYERRAVDAVFRHCPVVALPGSSRPLIRVADYLAFLEQHTYDGRSRVR
jgi:hypothetical protein